MKLICWRFREIYCTKSQVIDVTIYKQGARRESIRSESLNATILKGEM